jgi:hypothetical protein
MQPAGHEETQTPARRSVSGIDAMAVARVEYLSDLEAQLTATTPTSEENEAHVLRVHEYKASGSFSSFLRASVCLMRTKPCPSYKRRAAAFRWNVHKLRSS